MRGELISLKNFKKFLEIRINTSVLLVSSGKATEIRKILWFLGRNPNKLDVINVMDLVTLGPSAPAIRRPEVKVRVRVRL